MKIFSLALALLSAVSASKDGDKKVVAYVVNWDACPSPETLTHYTHAMVAFAVTYQYNGADDNCMPGSLGEKCEVQPVDGCGGKTIKEMVTYLKEAGLKTIISFGGAGLGGTWYPKNATTENAGHKVDHCWHHCHGKVDSIIESLDQIITDSGADGIDIDYEYYLDTDEDKTFLEDLTVKTWNKFNPKGIEVTHAPMDIDLCDAAVDAGCRDMYYNILKEHNDKVDFIMPQYYNQLTRPVKDVSLATKHYKNLVDNVYGGDGSKVVFGVCSKDCSGMDSNSNSEETLKIFKALNAAEPTWGGMMHWDTRGDADGNWSRPTVQYMECDLDATALDKDVVGCKVDPASSSSGPADDAGSDEASSAFAVAANPIAFVVVAAVTALFTC